MASVRLVIAGSKFGHGERWRAHVWHHADVWVEAFGKPRIVFEGEAPGVDTHGKAWAQQRGHPVKPFPADWETFGPAAGIYRNEFMLEETDPGDHLLAFPHLKKSWPGTKHCIGYATKLGLVVHVFPFA